MRMAINKIKWFAVSVSALSLLMVFWVWPAWNIGSQRWYLGNGETGDTSTMYRNQYPPPGHDSEFTFPVDFDHTFLANEAAMMMLNFGTAPWRYCIEVYRNGMMEPPGNATMGDLGYGLMIGRWKNSMFESFFEDKGMVDIRGSSMENPVVICGSTMSLGRSLNFEMGDMLAAMLTLMNDGQGEVHVVLNSNSHVDSPLSDPGYPGAAAQVPILSQWGMLLFAALIAVFSLFVMRRRVRMGRP